MVPWMHQRNIYIKRKLREWRAQKCNPCFSAKIPPSSTDRQSTRFRTSRIEPPVRICGNSGLPLGTVPWLHQRNIYVKRKLREWRTQKCNPCFSAKVPPSSTDRQITRFRTSRIEPPVRICGNSGLPLGTVPWLHQRNIYIKRMLREWRTQKCNPCLAAKSPPRSTDFHNIRFYASP